LHAPTTTANAPPARSTTPPWSASRDAASTSCTPCSATAPSTRHARRQPLDETIGTPPRPPYSRQSGARCRSGRTEERTGPAPLRGPGRSLSGLGAREGRAAGVDAGVVELLLDAQQLVVLVDALPAGGRAGLDLAGVHRDGEVGDGGVLGLPGAVRDHRGEAVALGQRDGVEGLGQGADLVELDEQGVGRLELDALGQPL